MFPDFAPNCFVSLSSGCWYVFVHYLRTSWLNFLSICWNVLFCLYGLILSWYIFSLPSFISTFWFISLRYIVCFTCGVAFFFLSQHIPWFYLGLTILACRRFLIYVSGQIFYPGFFCFCSCSLGCVVFRLLSFCGSFRSVGFSPVFRILIILLLKYQGQKTNLSLLSSELDQRVFGLFEI